MLTTKFTGMAFAPLFLTALWVILFGFVVAYLPGPDMPAIPVYVFSGMLTAMWLWVMLRELATKICVVSVGENAITVAGFYGLGPAREYAFSEITDHQTELKEAKSGTLEYFYLLNGAKKVVTLSELYHQNYRDLKHHLRARIRKNTKGAKKRQ